MNIPKLTLLSLVLCWAIVGSTQEATTAFTYQGRLMDAGQPANGVYDLTFTLYDAEALGGVVGTPITNSAVSVVNGLFAVKLDYGAAASEGKQSWLDIGVRKNGSTEYTPLSPRQELTSIPNANHSKLATLATTAQAVSAGSITSESLAPGSVTSADIANGTVVRSINGKTDNVSIPTNFWSLAGNSGTGPSEFIGTTDNRPLDLKANGTRGLRITAAEDTNGAPSITIVGGSPVNYATTNAYASVIAGGGSADYLGEHYTNSVAAGFAFLGSGGANTIEYGASGGVLAGGWYNTLHYRASGSAIGGGGWNTSGSNANYAVIAGGARNTNTAQYSAILGGLGNRAGAYASVVGGQHNVATGTGSFIAGGTESAGDADGTNNYAGGLQSSVLGGSGNAAYGRYGTILGGLNNAAGDYALAGGRRAKAYNSGSFVWADATDTDFQSTGDNQFLIRASGNVGINTTTPQSTLHVAGTVTATSFSGSGAGLTGIGATAISDGSIGSAELANEAASLSKVSAGQLTSISGNLQASTDFFLGNRDFYLRGYNDRDHGLGYYGLANAARPFAGVNVDGPVLYGYNGGALGIKETGIKTNIVLYWSAAGRVGVGTTSPASTFDVNGTITAPAITGTGSNPLELQVNGGRALQLSPATYGGTAAPIIIGGSGNTALSAGTTIGGGSGNSADGLSYFGAIAGGQYNVIALNAPWSTISGGQTQRVGPNSWYATIGGGRQNTIGANAGYSFIGSGGWNSISNSSSYAVIAGGYNNLIHTNSYDSFIGAGMNNSILSNAFNSVLAGGEDNHITARLGTIGGGAHNLVSGAGATIPGGNSNEARGINSFAAGTGAQALGDGSFVLTDASSYAGWGTSEPNYFIARFTHGYSLYTTGIGVMLKPGSGTWTDLSDRNAKDNLEPVDQQRILEEVAALPVTTWNYKAQDPSIRHMGPMAQDFKAAFGIGESDTGITTIDADGVALAAIQGLNQKVESLTAQLEAQNAALAKQVAELKSMVEILAAKVAGR